MISGTEILSARQRAGLTQEQLGQMVGVTLRTVGNWERGETVPRNREAAIRHVLADHLDDALPPVSLRLAADAELLAEIARRFAQARTKGSGSGGDTAPTTGAEVTSAQDGTIVPVESTDTEGPSRKQGSRTRSRAKPRTGIPHGGGTAESTTP